MAIAQLASHSDHTIQAEMFYITEEGKSWSARGSAHEPKAINVSFTDTEPWKSGTFRDVFRGQLRRDGHADQKVVGVLKISRHIHRAYPCLS